MQLAAHHKISQYNQHGQSANEQVVFQFCISHHPHVVVGHSIYRPQFVCQSQFHCTTYGGFTYENAWKSNEVENIDAHRVQQHKIFINLQTRKCEISFRVADCAWNMGFLGERRGIVAIKRGVVIVIRTVWL